MQLVERRMDGGVDYMTKSNEVRRIIIFGMGIVLILGLYGCSTQNSSDFETIENIDEPKAEFALGDKEDKDHINDLLFRKYNIGHSIGEGIVIIQKDVVLQNVSSLDATIVIFCNDQVLEMLTFEGEDLF